MNSIYKFKRKIKKIRKNGVKASMERTLFNDQVGSDEEEIENEDYLLSDFVYELKSDQIKIIKYIGKEKTIRIPQTIEGKVVTIIDTQAFANLSFIEKIELPETVETINKGAFKNCSSLKTIELPEALTVLNSEIFKGCTSLVSIGLPYDLKRICKSAFEGCSSLKQFYYFSKRGISNVMKTSRNLRENQLPVFIEHIGNKAFKNCSSLTEVTIPYNVKVINKSVFEGCLSLEKVCLHNRIKIVKRLALKECPSLKEIKLPLRLKKISNHSFTPTTAIMSEQKSAAFKFAQKYGLKIKSIPKLKEMPQLSSQMIPFSVKNEFIPLEKYQTFYSNEQLNKIVDKYEMRMPPYEPIERELLEPPLPTKTARYEFRDGAYVNKNTTMNNRAVIMMVGDLMCDPRQQKLSYENGKYCFEDSFFFIKDIIAQSDFAIGNLETMISPSSPFTTERAHVSARPHLNAPESFLGAVRNASFDAVVNAQNHVYDTGTLGIMETLAMQNKYQLMHTGAYASPSDKRYLIVEINNIKIAILAYLDGARQQMKKANFTNIGLKVLLNIYGTEHINRDIADAKGEGAEFIIAYCHWGREYTHDITKRQKRFAAEVANAGVDFIFGAHSHCVQPYDEIQTKDHRTVPVIYSGGNFLSAINIKAPITRDTFISELTLVKDDNGKVKIESNGYYPCRIMKLGKEEKNYAVIPTQVKFKGRPKRSNALKIAEERIEHVLGEQITKLTPRGIELNISLKETPFYL